DRLEAGRDEAGHDRFDRQCRRLSREILAPFGAADRGPDAVDPTVGTAAAIARIVERAQGVIADRSEEEDRLHDWLDLLQDALLPALNASAERPETTRPGNERDARARHPRIHR